MARVENLSTSLSRSVGFATGSLAFAAGGSLPSLELAVAVEAVPEVFESVESSDGSVESPFKGFVGVVVGSSFSR